jgi:hypothetical protein
MDIPTISQIQLLFNFLPIKMEQSECSETSTYKIQTPGNYPEENIQHTEHGERLKSRIHRNLLQVFIYDMEATHN